MTRRKGVRPPPDFKRLGADEARVVAALLDVLIEQKTGPEVNIVVGGEPDDLRLPAAWKRGGASSKASRLCEALASRGIFVRQHGDEYLPDGSEGIGDVGGSIWYSFDRRLFIQGDEESETLRLRLLRSIEKHLPRGTREQLLLGGLTLAGAVYDP